MQEPSGRKLRVALVGCGQIADAHLQEIGKLPLAEVVALCDRKMDLAMQAAVRFRVPHRYDSLEQMLDEIRPDVLHVTTPPQSHLGIALKALAAGAHLYVEKPFTIDAAEAKQLFTAATAAGKLVCAGHDQLFDPIWTRGRALCARGELGRIVHIDSVMGYNLSGPFGKLLGVEPDHWVHSLPGGLFQNNISHAVYRITDFLPDQRPEVWAHWHGAIGSTGRPSELRVMLQGREASAHLVFSSAMRPVFRLARIHGTQGSMEIDVDSRVLRRYQPAKLPGALAKLEAPFRHLCEAGRSFTQNLRSFIRSDLQYFAGMRNLFTAFYGAILDGGEPPIPYSDVLRVTQIMDDIFEACQSDSVLRRRALCPADESEPTKAFETAAEMCGG